ncbi:MAG: SCO family protein [Polyangia bacterium]
MKPAGCIRALAVAVVLTPALVSARPALPEPQPALATPPAVAAVDIDEKLGAAVPLDLTFTDSNRRPVRLRDFADAQRPVVLVLAYYRCPMLCDLVLGGISRTLHQLGWVAGRDYRGVTVSIDPHDTPPVAHLKQNAVLQAVGQTGPEAERGWPFLVGDAHNIAALADAVGFRYAYDPRSRQFAHPAVVMILTPDGRVSRYLYGVNFHLLDVRLALTEASHGKVGGIVDRVLLTCFHYDPSARRYGFYVSAVLKGGATCALLAVGAFLTVLWRRDARRMRGRGA